MLIKRLAIIGVGLIGGSLARALKQAAAVEYVSGFSPDETEAERAVEFGVVDRCELDPAAAVVDADVAVIAVPLGAMQAVMAAIASVVPTHAIATDVGSVKAPVMAWAQQYLRPRGIRFVPGHPIAGTEKSGVDAAVIDLFRNRRVILTPDPDSEHEAVKLITRMWQATGAVVEVMDAVAHDQVLAATSHLPHVLAYALVDKLAAMDGDQSVFRYAAGGFADLTRVASSNPVMWRDIVFANAEAVAAILESYGRDLAGLAEAIRVRDGDKVLQVFTRAKQARDAFAAARCQSADAHDTTRGCSS
jgi:prephenate dehydrogenase